MIEEQKDNPVYSETAYDDAFRTMEGKCDDLLIPFVSHMFDEKYDSTAEIKRYRNEHFVEHGDGSEEKRVTDSHFDITYKGVTKRYHLECSNMARKLRKIQAKRTFTEQDSNSLIQEFCCLGHLTRLRSQE